MATTAHWVEAKKTLERPQKVNIQASYMQIALEKCMDHGRNVLIQWIWDLLWDINL